MRALFLVCTFAIASYCSAAARDVSVFIAPRSSFIPASGKVAIDVYWNNHAERPRAIPNMESYSFVQIIDNRSGKGVGRVTGSAQIVDHPGPDRLIPARTILRDQIVAEIKVTRDEVVKLSAEFWGGRCGTFKSNTVVLTKR